MGIQLSCRQFLVEANDSITCHHLTGSMPTLGAVPTHACSNRPVPLHVIKSSHCIIASHATICLPQRHGSMFHQCSHHHRRQQQQQLSPQLSQQRHAVLTAAAGKGFGSPGKVKSASSSSSKARRKCPCGSGKAYEVCCGRFVAGSTPAPDPEALLRSRFSAYALQEVDYLVKTTHRQNPEHTGGAKSYARVLRATAAQTEYLQLDIVGPVAVSELPQAYLQKLGSNGGSGSGTAVTGQDGAAEQEMELREDDAFLRFSVKFRPRGGGGEMIANETSHFKKVDGEWLYFNEVEV